PDAAAARTIISAAMKDGRAWLDPIEIAGLFAAYGIPIVPTLKAENPDDAAAKAERLLAQGSGVAVKILSRDITHKSDVGGVMLRLTSREAVTNAAAEVMARTKRARPEARIDGVLIQPMIA